MAQSSARVNRFEPFLSYLKKAAAIHVAKPEFFGECKSHRPRLKI